MTTFNFEENTGTIKIGPPPFRHCYLFLAVTSYQLPVWINEELLPVLHGHLAVLLGGAVHHLDQPLTAHVAPHLT